MDLRSLEAALERHLSTHSVEDLQGFPGRSHSDFLARQRAGSLGLLTGYDATAFDVLASRGERVVHFLVLRGPFVIGLGLVALSISQSNYWPLFVGLPAALLVDFFARYEWTAPTSNGRPHVLTPYALLLWMAPFTILAIWDLVDGDYTRAAIAGSYALCNSLIGAARLQCDRVMREAIAQSELVLVWLYLRGRVMVLQRPKSGSAAAAVAYDRTGQMDDVGYMIPSNRAWNWCCRLTLLAGLWHLWNSQGHLVLWWSMVGLLAADLLISKTARHVAQGGDRDVFTEEEAQGWLRTTAYVYLGLGFAEIAVAWHAITV